MAWDITTQLAVASGLLALRDAEFHLPVEQAGKGGLRLITNWQVPKYKEIQALCLLHVSPDYKWQ